MDKKLKLVIFLDDIFVSKSLYHFVIKLKTNPKYNLVGIVINKYNNIKSYKSIYKIFYTLSFKIEYFLINLARLSTKRETVRKYNLAKVIDHKIYLSPKVVHYKYIYESKDVNKIESLEADIALNESSYLIDNQIINIFPKGVLLIHYIENNFNLDFPIGFWNIYYRKPTTPFYISHLIGNNRSKILFKGYISTSFINVYNYEKLLRKAYAFLNKTLETFQSQLVNQLIKYDSTNDYRLLSFPNFLQQLCYLLLTFKRIFKKNYIWGVSYQFVNEWKNFDFRKSILIKNPKGRWLADPFVWSYEGSHYCFVEDFSYKNQKACISVFKINNSGYQEIGIALEESFHLSYPFLFSSNDTLYMCPETSHAKDIRIYKCIDFPLVWKLHKVLLTDIIASDTSIFYQNNLWWLLTNKCTEEKGDNNSELHIYSTNDLLYGEWEVHPMNPVIVDPLIARNAGLIIESDSIFRSYQVQGFNQYGYGVGVSKIINIDKEEYIEHKRLEILSNSLKKIRGIHTFNYKDGLLVFDIEISDFI